MKPMIHAENSPDRRRSAAAFLQGVVVLAGIGALTVLVGEPLTEGRNAHATLTQVYFGDPFLAYAYTASIAFFVALYQGFKLLGRAGRNEGFSHTAVREVRTIKYCALILAAFIMGGEAHSFLFVRGHDDIAGGVMIGLALLFLSIVAATAAAVLERTLQRAVELQAENDLTV